MTREIITKEEHNQLVNDIAKYIRNKAYSYTDIEDFIYDAIDNIGIEGIKDEIEALIIAVKGQFSKEFSDYEMNLLKNRKSILNFIKNNNFFNYLSPEVILDTILKNGNK